MSDSEDLISDNSSDFSLEDDINSSLKTTKSLITEPDKSIDKYQPDAKNIPKQTWGINKKAYFQNSWYLKHP